MLPPTQEDVLDEIEHLNLGVIVNGVEHITTLVTCGVAGEASGANPRRE